VHKKTGGETLYTALITMLSCHHFKANVWDRQAETLKASPESVGETLCYLALVRRDVCSRGSEYSPLV